MRVVTREERLVECLAALARLDNAIRAAAAQDADGTATAALRERRETLAALLDGTVLDGVAQRLAAEAAFVRDTVEQRRIAAAEAKAAALRQARQQRANAEILLRELAAKGGGDATIADALQRVRSGQCDGSDAERIVREAAAKLVVAAPEPALGDVQREIAKRLRANEALADYVIWQVPADPRERRLQRIEQRLAQLSVLLGDALADAFAARLRSLESAPDDARGHLLADSLIADLQAAVDQARQTAALVAAAEDLLAGIESAAATDGAQDIAAQAAALRAAIADGCGTAARCRVVRRSSLESLSRATGGTGAPRGDTHRTGDLGLRSPRGHEHGAGCAGTRRAEESGACRIRRRDRRCGRRGAPAGPRRRVRSGARQPPRS